MGTSEAQEYLLPVRSPGINNCFFTARSDIQHTHQITNYMLPAVKISLAGLTVFTFFILKFNLQKQVKLHEITSFWHFVCHLQPDTWKKGSITLMGRSKEWDITEGPLILIAVSEDSLKGPLLNFQEATFSNLQPPPERRGTWDFWSA